MAAHRTELVSLQFDVDQYGEAGDVTVSYAADGKEYTGVAAAEVISGAFSWFNPQFAQDIKRVFMLIDTDVKITNVNGQIRSIKKVK